jgi:hypothetical protein
MPHARLTPEVLRRAADALARVARGDVQLASRVVGEVLLAQAEQRSAAVSHALIDARMGSHGASAATAEVEGTRPLDVLRQGPRDERERALVSVLMAQHLAALCDGDGGAARVRALLPGLDWLEFTGPYAPYSAARATFARDTLARLDALLASAPLDACSEPAAAAVRALRGLTPAPLESADTLREVPFTSGEHPVPTLLTLAGELEGEHRGGLARTLGVLTGWSLLRGAALAIGRGIFSLRRPMTLSLEGGTLRVLGHTELLGRTLRTFDVRYPVRELVEIRREARFPALPVALSAVALGVGAILGARAVVEGAGVAYFPLIALGLGLLVGGLVFDLLLRALFPGVRGRGRLLLRARDARAVVLTDLSLEELDRLLDALDAQFAGSAATDRAATAAPPEAEAPTTETLPARPAARPARRR